MATILKKTNSLGKQFFKLSFAGVTSLCILVALLSFTAYAGPRTLRFGTVDPEDHPYNIAAKNFGEAVSKATNGELELKVFPNSLLGTADRLLEGLQLGSIDFVLTASTSVSTVISKVGVFSLPYIFRDRKHAFTVLDGSIGKEVGALAEAKGFRILGFAENGWRHMTNNVRQINEPPDCVGLRMRVIPSPVYVKTIESLGAKAVPIAYAELYTSLQQGVVDGQENPYVNIYKKRFFEVQKFLSATAHTYEPAALMVSLKTWNTLSESSKKVIEREAVSLIRIERELMEKSDIDYLNLLLKTGISINESPNRESFRKVMANKVWVQFEKEYGTDLINRIASVK